MKKIISLIIICTSLLAAARGFAQGMSESARQNELRADSLYRAYEFSRAAKIYSQMAETASPIYSADDLFSSRDLKQTADLSEPGEIAVFETLQSNMQAVDLGIGHKFESCVISMPEPTLDDTLPDNERFVNALSAVTGSSDIHIGFYALSRLSTVMRENDFTVSVIFERNESRIDVLDLLPLCEPAVICGIAIDIGTTTVSGVLTDMKDGKLLAKASAGNGQIRYGADVINRIVEQTKEGGIAKLQKAIINETLIPLDLADAYRFWLWWQKPVFLLLKERNDLLPRHPKGGGQMLQTFHHRHLDSAMIKPAGRSRSRPAFWFWRIP